MQVEIWSDVICPWCYIGKRRFDQALHNVAARRDISTVHVTYKPYQLDPTAAPGKVQRVVDAYARKFGGYQRAEQILDHLTEVAAGDGLEFHMELAQRANTLLAHRVIWFAETHGDQAAVKERLLRAYFVEGLNISDPDVLADCAADAGLDHDAVAAMLAGDDGRDEIVEQLVYAAANGITAVPTYVFDGRWEIPGAQDVEVFERVIDKMLDRELEREGLPANV